MGSGTYYAVGFGCAELPTLGDDDRQLFEIFEKHNIQTSYEGDSNYAVVPLLSTLAGRCDREIPSGVMPIEEFANAIRNRVGTGSLERAAETWRIVQAAALDVSIHLPDGRLLWLCDYE